MAHSTVAASRGLDWLKDAVGLVFANPVVFLVNALIFAVLLALLALIPLLGQIAVALLAPVFGAGMVYAYREQDQGGQAQIEHLFQGFREPGKFGPLALLGVPGLIAAVLLTIVGFLMLGGAALGAVVAGGADSGAGVLGALGGGLMLFVLLALATGLVLFALLVFAIPRVMFDGAEPFAAMKESLEAALANVGPLLVFVLIYFVAFIVASVILALIPVLGQLVVSLFASAIGSATIYLAYKDVFRSGEASVTPAEPPPPPPA